MNIAASQESAMKSNDRNKEKQTRGWTPETFLTKSFYLILTSVNSFTHAHSPNIFLVYCTHPRSLLTRLMSSAKRFITHVPVRESNPLLIKTIDKSIKPEVGN